MKARTIKDLNQILYKISPDWAQGVLDAANLVNDLYSGSTTHKYLLGDCLLAKLNLLDRRCRIRKIK